MIIVAVYENQEPNFPATDQQPDAVRYQIGQRWVDAVGLPAPVEADVDAFLAPTLAYSIPKDLPWRRMTDAEAATAEQILDNASPRLRQIYNAASVLSTGDELFETLKGYMVEAFGEARTDELLAPDA